MKIIRASIYAIPVLLLTFACVSDSRPPANDPNGSSDSDPDTGDDSGSERDDDPDRGDQPLAGCPAAVGNLVPVEIGPKQCRLTGTLFGNGVLSADLQWFLEGKLQVGDNNHSSVLKVEAGTYVYGDNADTVDYLLVVPGSALVAEGTAQNPVRFLSDDADVDGSGEWGGIYLQGSNGVSAGAKAQGANRLDYVVVAEAGAAVNISENGQNTIYADNIVLSGVDEQTVLTFVQSHRSARDGFHITNANPRMSWILATGSGRDGVWYQDFSGVIKDLMVIHERDLDGSTGRAGIYASETVEGNSNPSIVNVTLIGGDETTESASDAPDDKEFGILFADNTDQIRLANVLIANFRNGCFEANNGADLSGIEHSTLAPTYLDGVHCVSNFGVLDDFGVVRANAVGFPSEPVATVAPVNSINANGLVYYDGTKYPAIFTGQFADRRGSFTAGWYLANIGGIGNGLSASLTSLNGFLDGDTNQDGVVNGDDNGSSYMIADDGANGVNQDVADDTYGYDLTHIGASRSGNPEVARHFDGWTVATGGTDGFAVAYDPELAGISSCPASVGGANVTPLERAGGRNVCQVVGVVTEDAVLGDNIEWALEGRLQVGDRENIATLTIEGGTRVRGGIEGTVVDHVLVFPGSAIDAQGSGARPIRFTSDDPDTNGSGEWGGVFLHGTNNLPTLGGRPQGANKLDYVVVAEAGALVDVSVDGVDFTHRDNIVVNGVDSTTTLTFVQSHDSARDGFHINDGDPRMSWLLVTGAQRDGFWYRDFSGLVKDLLVIHRPDADGTSGRAGLYASETQQGDSNPRIVNVTLYGADNSSADTGEGANANEFGVLFANGTDAIQLANVIITNFRKGCYKVESAADLSNITTDISEAGFLSGVHCSNEINSLSDAFAVVQDGSSDLPAATVAAPNSNGPGFVYYDGVSTEVLPLDGAIEQFELNAGGVNFTGEIAERGNHFTAGWYLDNIRGLGNGLGANSNFLTGFLDGDTNQDGNVDGADNGSPFIISADVAFNQDVAEDTNGYDLTHIGAVRGGAVTNAQYDNWSVGTTRSSPFTLR